MGFVYYNQIVIAPVQSIQIQTIGFAVGTIQICMVEDIITQTIRRNRVVHIVILIGIPVIRQLLRAENKHRFISVFVIFDNCQSGKGFTKTNTICQNTAIEFFQLADDCKHSIFLEVIKHRPYLAFLKSGSLIRQMIFGHIF